MTIYVLTYDFYDRDNRPIPSRGMLVYFSNHDAYRILDSVWLLSSNETLDDIRSHFKKHYLNHSEDRFWVSEVKKHEFAHFNLDNNGAQWLRDHGL